MRWTVVIPVFNEAGFLPRTLQSLAAQDTPFRLVVVDNGSTDGCIEAAADLASRSGLDAAFLNEPRPGQVHALRRGLAEVRTELTAICDADTWYPPHYLSLAARLFDDAGPDCVAVAAYQHREGAGSVRTWLSRLHRLGAARLMPRQNHTSGAAQAFRTAELRAAGGYDPAIWPYVLKDHELMHRMLQRGSQRYHRDLWCVPSGRRADRRAVRWTLPERLAYHLTPFELKHRFFHDFLARRFEARGQRDIVLRRRTWEAAAAARP
jgi:glycosyltransferase involved in cell wall biosynthesis